MSANEKTPVEARNELNEALAAFARGARPNLVGAKSREDSAREILGMLSDRPWLHDQVPFDVLEILRGAAGGRRIS